MLDTPPHVYLPSPLPQASNFTPFALAAMAAPHHAVATVDGAAGSAAQAGAGAEGVHAPGAHHSQEAGFGSAAAAD
eukprot:306053-Chlamydomonas_euryale.AAC.1